jgi:diguanylate cyclase (GGDEF)-like protein
MNNQLDFAKIQVKKTWLRILFNILIVLSLCTVISYFLINNINNFYLEKYTASELKLHEDMISNQILDGLITEDAVALNSILISLSEGLPDIITVNVFNEQNTPLAEFNKLAPVNAQLVSHTAKIVLSGEVFGFLIFNLDISNRIMLIKQESSVLNFLYLMLIIIISGALILIIHYQSKKELLKSYELSYRDALTGLPNRLMLNDYVKKIFGGAVSNENEIAVIMIDVDFFKNYNDTYGHLQGDACLRLLSDALHTSVKRSNDIVARVGGEEFVIIVSAKHLNVELIIENCQKRISNLNIKHEQSKCSDVVTASFGYKIIDNNVLDFQQALKEADAALYQAKKNGRNRAEKYNVRGCTADSI